MSAPVNGFFYEVLQGMPNPRDGTISWRSWSYYPGTLEGKRQAKRDAKGLSYGCVISGRVIWKSASVMARESDERPAGEARDL